jgi:very-short-patch-repair endonuclease
VAELDLAWPDARLCVELDSWKHHASRAAFAEDRGRDRALFCLGWAVLRYTWDDISLHRARVSQELGQALRQRLAGTG